ncbi:MAG: hypothetical protein JW927_05595 [Deltaproteobacteria bacterium]|nr:hypothetical protein [Deltaproteobacteria bacterium]
MNAKLRIQDSKLLRFVPVEKANKLANLALMPDVIVGKPDDLADISREKEVNLDLPCISNPLTVNLFHVASNKK